MEHPLRKALTIVVIFAAALSGSTYAAVQNAVIFVRAQWGEGKPEVKQYMVSVGKEATIYSGKPYRIVVALKSELPGDMLEFKFYDLSSGKQFGMSKGDMPTDKKRPVLQIGESGSNQSITIEAAPSSQ